MEKVNDANSSSGGSGSNSSSNSSSNATAHYFPSSEDLNILGLPQLDLLHAKHLIRNKHTSADGIANTVGPNSNSNGGNRATMMHSESHFDTSADSHGHHGHGHGHGHANDDGIGIQISTLKLFFCIFKLENIAKNQN
jgi:hypothetical protein